MEKQEDKINQLIDSVRIYQKLTDDRIYSSNVYIGDRLCKISIIRQVDLYTCQICKRDVHVRDLKFIKRISLHKNLLKCFGANINRKNVYLCSVCDIIITKLQVEQLYMKYSDYWK